MLICAVYKYITIKEGGGGGDMVIIMFVLAVNYETEITCTCSTCQCRSKLSSLVQSGLGQSGNPPNSLFGQGEKLA